MSEFFCEKECEDSDYGKCANAEEERISLQIRQLSNYVRKTVDLIALDSELTGLQSFLLGHLVYQAGKKDIYQKDVEKFLHISKASVTSLLQQMEKKECIRRESVEGDARLKRIVVTPKGREINDAIINNLTLMERSMSKDISEQELRIFFSVTRKVARNLNDVCKSFTEKKE